MTAIPGGAIWIPQSRTDAKLHLYCFAYAGGGANVFRDWEKALGADIELRAVQLPGREWRRHELPYRRMTSLLDGLVSEIASTMSTVTPYAFFGYSMGAAVAYSIARCLRELHRPLPAAMILAACRAPSLLRNLPTLHELDDVRFLEAIRRFGGMPEALLAEPELLKMLLPVLRADFEVLGTYNYEPVPPLPISSIVYGGMRDPHAPRAELAAWRQETTADFALRLFSGGHFFINEVRSQLLSTLTADLGTLIRTLTGVSGINKQAETQLTAAA
jgi:surfactin synthase thioesterase subunit